MRTAPSPRPLAKLGKLRLPRPRSGGAHDSQLLQSRPATASSRGLVSAPPTVDTSLCLHHPPAPPAPPAPAPVLRESSQRRTSNPLAPPPNLDGSHSKLASSVQRPAARASRIACKRYVCSRYVCMYVCMSARMPICCLPVCMVRVLVKRPCNHPLYKCPVYATDCH